MPKGRRKHQVKVSGAVSPWLEATLGDQASSKEYRICLIWRQAIEVEDLLRRLKLAPTPLCVSPEAETMKDEHRLKLVGQMIRMVERAIREKKSGDLKRLVRAVEALPYLSKKGADPLRKWILETYSTDYRVERPTLRNVTMNELATAAHKAKLPHGERQVRRTFKDLGGVILKSKRGPKQKPNS